MGKDQRYADKADARRKHILGQPPVLPMMKENDWDTGNEIRY